MKGRWKDVLPALGIPQRFLDGKHQACPKCGGKDRARFDDKEGCGTWICSHCGAGGGLALVALVNNCDLEEAEAKVRVAAGLGANGAQPAAKYDEDKRRREKMNRLWKISRPISAGDPAALYLGRRLGLTVYPPALRCIASTLYSEGDSPRSWHPAMLALVTALDGSGATLHRTFLTPDGWPADVEKKRLIMSGPWPAASAVRLTPIAEEIGIAEGIETALAATVLTEIPCWAALTRGRLIAWKPPEGVRRVVVFGDCDENFAGQSGAYELAFRLASTHEVEVRIPEIVGEDWNTVLNPDCSRHRDKLVSTDYDAGGYGALT